MGFGLSGYTYKTLCEEGELLPSVLQWITAFMEDTTCNDVIDIEKMAGNEIEGHYHLDYGWNAKTSSQ